MLQFKGMACVSWDAEAYASPGGSASRAALAAVGANWASLLTTWYQDADGNAIGPIASTPSDAALATAIADCHAKGIKVMLKPHVDTHDGTWRALIAPTDLDTWFQAYTAFIVHYASLAAQCGVDLFCVGCELKTMTGGANRDRWVQVVQAVRQAYPGPLVYAANACGEDDEYVTVAFWDQLDYIGLDAYFRLSQVDATQAADDVPLQDLIQGWGDENNGIVKALKDFHDSQPGGAPKPLLFTEIGFKSVPGASSEPWNSTRAGDPDPVEQDHCYQATLAVWSQQGDWWQGLFWWAWGIGQPDACDYTPWGKPAEQTLRTWFGAHPG